MREDQTDAHLLGGLSPALLLLIETFDRLIGHRAADDGFHQHVAEDAFMHRFQSTLGGGALVQTATASLGGQKLLIHHLVQHAAEQLGLNVQRLALADQPLGHGFATHVGGPDGGVQNAGHDQIILFGRGLRIAASAGGGQNQRRRGRGQQGGSGSKSGARKTHQALRPKAKKGRKTVTGRPVAASP
ncbi:hypothetical protein D3C72_1702070 [compost metagenome]